MMLLDGGTWDAVYCTDGGRPTAKATVTSDTALRLWVHEVDLDRGVRGLIFDDSFTVDTPNAKQWGTDYWWLTVTRKADKMRVSRNPDPEIFEHVYAFPWDLTCPKHGVVDSFLHHSMAMDEAWHHIKTEHVSGNTQTSDHPTGVSADRKGNT